MDKKELRKQLEETKTQLKGLCNDAHHAEVLIDKIVSLKGQMMIDPTLVHIPLSDVIDSIDGETFSLSKTKQGVVYHQKNGFNLFIPLNGMTNGLFEMINWLVDNKEKIETEEQDVKDFYKYTMLDVAYTFQMIFGMWTNDKELFDFRAESINKYIEIMTKKLNEIANGEAHEEDHAENAEFEKTLYALDTLKEEVKNS